MVAPTASADGYGCAAEALILSAVRSHGADIAFIEHDWRDSRYTDPDLMAMCVQEHSQPVKDRDVMVVMFLPFALTRFRSWTTLLFTMWETDRIPDLWARIIEPMADGVIVPSEHCREVFQESVSVPVLSVPFGTDTDLYTERDRSVRHPFAQPFTFLMAGLLHYRKGLEFALRAFREEFDSGEDVCLVLKTRRHFLDAGDEFRTLSDPRVTVIDSDFTREQMRDLYHSADCFLAPSRGEGSGLTPRDAMATGLPVILTDWSGLQEIADPIATWPIPVDCLEPAPETNSSYGAGVTGGGPIGNFARPSIPALRAAMREAYEYPQMTREKGRLAATWMRREFTWNRCAGLWLKALEQLSVVEETA